MTKQEEMQTYRLNCDKCGEVFESSEAFPDPHICGNCSRREEIEKGLYQLARDTHTTCVYGDIIEDILKYLHSQDTAIIDRNRKLPDITDGCPCEVCKYYRVHSEIPYKVLLEAGYVATIPLIGER